MGLLFKTKALAINLLYRRKFKRCKISFSVLITKKTAVGLNCNIRKMCNISNASIGSNTNIGRGCNLGGTSIGKFCSISWNVSVIAATHPLDMVSTSKNIYSSFQNRCFKDESIKTINDRTVEIGNDVWIGANVLIKGGVTIGNGAVVGMGSVVTKDVPPYAIVAGNPAKIIRYRFSFEQISKLQEIKWWDWEENKILDCIDDFANVENFIKNFSTK